MTTEIEDKIESAHYAVTEHEVELLASAHLACTDATKRTDGAYLRILVASAQAQFGKPVKGRRKDPTKAEMDNHRVFLSDTHARFYKAVLRGVTTDDIADVDGLKPEERRDRAARRNARAGFARSAASTLQRYVRSGGDVRTLDVATVTKTSLTLFAIASGESRPPSVNAISAALKRIEDQAKAMMADNPDDARSAVADCIRRLEHLMEDVLMKDTGVESGIFQPARAPAGRRQPAAAAPP